MKGRSPFDFYGRWELAGNASLDDRRVAKATASIVELNGHWTSVAAKIAEPVARALGLSRVLTSEWFTHQQASWARGG